MSVAGMYEAGKAPDREVVTREDLNNFEHLRKLVTGMKLDAQYEVIPPAGIVNLNRDNHVVICGPRRSPIVAQVLEGDDNLRFAKDTAWHVVDQVTGKEYRSPADEDGSAGDVGYLGRLPRLDGKGTFLYLAGIHAIGASGVVHYLENNLAELYREVRTRRFSTLISCRYDPKSPGEPTRHPAVPTRRLSMRVAIDTQPGGAAPNEDWVAGTPTLAIVLDGLSTAGLDTGCRHGVPWYVAHLGSQLVAALADPEILLAAGLSDALERVAALHPECDLRNPGTPSATVAVLRQRAGFLDHLVLADSPVVLEGHQDITVITDLRVDDVLVELRAEVEQYETHTADHKEALRRFVAAQRQIRNTPAGYWVAAADPEAADHAFAGCTATEDVRAAAVLSDGVSRLVTEYAMATWAEVFTALRTGGPRELINTVRKVESTDPTGRRWPRYKSGDDASVAFCQW
ncbi:hypothetical protein AB0F30_01585 [Streptomyces sp. NPDC029006]|uniref:hypothetical protein n=1 Tax=Streptomyces sp. NPDC029006 TaxID=3155467 RepID=UPI00340BAE8D